MSLRAKATLFAMLLTSPLAAAAPVWASGGPSSGGAASGGASPPSATSGPPGAGTPAQPVSTPATATGDGITVTSNVAALLGHALVFTGTTSPASAGALIVAQRLDPLAGWVTVAGGTVDSAGAFSIPWQTDSVGQMTVRTVLEQAATASQAGPNPPTLQITVYRSGLATFYGRGFFGRKTACGKTLRRTTLGVASRTLKCGTPVQLYYRGRTIVVPVIDRGPYANHASWDLTQATAQALGMLGTETVGAMPI